MQDKCWWHHQSVQTSFGDIINPPRQVLVTSSNAAVKFQWHHREGLQDSSGLFFSCLISLTSSIHEPAFCWHHRAHSLAPSSQQVNCHHRSLMDTEWQFDGHEKSINGHCHLMANHAPFPSTPGPSYRFLWTKRTGLRTSMDALTRIGSQVYVLLMRFLLLIQEVKGLAEASPRP